VRALPQAAPLSARPCTSSPWRAPRSRKGAARLPLYLRSLSRSSSRATRGHAQARARVRSQLLSVGQVGADEELAAASTSGMVQGFFESSGSVSPAKSRWRSRPRTSSRPVFPAWLAGSVIRSPLRLLATGVRRPLGGGGRDHRDGPCAAKGAALAQHHGRVPDAAAHPAQPR